jgi:beta-lactamase regulating signal transducer with metallopeptidase domain/tetratricopeptide (TPR) repeat protein
MNATMGSCIRFALDIALKATLLFSITALATALLRRSGAAARHMAATAGLLGALALPLLTLALPPLDLPVFPSVFSAAPASSSRVALEKELAPAAKNESEIVQAVETDSRSPAVSNHGERTATARPSSTPVPWLLLGLAAWSAGVLLVAARLAVGLLRVRGIRREAAPLSDPEWTDEARRLARQLDVRRSVKLLESARVPVAMTSGLRRPFLLLCRQARFWAVERRRVVLLHELAHVRRADWLWLLLTETALAIYWWHPLAWVLARQVRRDCERACDDLVLTAGTKPSVYAGHLLGIFRSLSAAAHPVAPALASERPSHFEGRLRAILDPAEPRRERQSGRGFLSAAGLLAAAAGIAVVHPWAPACVNASPLLPYSDAQETQASATVPRVAAATACEKAKGRKAAPAMAPAVASSPRPDSLSRPQSAPEPAVAPEPEQPLTEQPLPESSGSLPAILKTIKSVKDIAGGFVRASNGGSRKSGSDWYSRGMDLHHDDRYDEAIEAFQKAIEAGYREDAASYNIACGYALKGDRDKAFEWLRKAAEAGFEVASYLERDDDLDNLKSDPRWKELKKTVKEHPSARREREAAAATTSYERLVARAPKDGEPFYNMGKELLNAGRYELSAKAFQAAADRGFRVGTSLYNEACALSRAGEKRAALDLLQKALNAGFDQPDIFRKDDDLDNVRDEPRFAEIVREARDLSLPNLGVNKWVFGSGSTRTKWRESARKAEEYARAHPQSGRAWFNLGYASLEGDRPEAAIEAFQKAFDLGYRKPTTMYNLACGYARLDKKDQAFDWLFKALDAGFDGAGTLRGDEDLDNLRGDPRYRKALAIAKAKEQSEDD